jgi:hypothetical protein
MQFNRNLSVYTLNSCHGHRLDRVTTDPIQPVTSANRAAYLGFEETARRHAVVERWRVSRTEGALVRGAGRRAGPAMRGSVSRHRLAHEMRLAIADSNSPACSCRATSPTPLPA